MTSRYAVIDVPTGVSRAAYESAATGMAERLKSFNGISSVYQIGSVSSPGISDLDMVAIFDGDSECHNNPRTGLDKVGNYLFAHDLYGATISEFRTLNRYSLFHNYEIVWGKDIRADLPGPPEDSEQALRTQIALEFLVRMYVNMTMQKDYGVIKLRGFLLHTKAIAYDLEFLNVNSGELHDLTLKCIEARNRWFRQPMSWSDIAQLFDDFYEALANFLGEQLEQHSLYLPKRQKYTLSPPVELRQSRQLDAHRSGLRLPRSLSLVGPKYFNLQNRLNRFMFDIPFQTQDIPPFLAERFGAVDAARDYHRRNLPRFAVLMSSLAIQ